MDLKSGRTIRSNLLLEAGAFLPTLAQLLILIYDEALRLPLTQFQNLSKGVSRSMRRGRGVVFVVNLLDACP